MKTLYDLRELIDECLRTVDCTNSTEWGGHQAERAVVYYALTSILNGSLTESQGIEARLYINYLQWGAVDGKPDT